MTRAELRKLAKAARDLAMECVAGTAPEFGEYFEWRQDGSPCCANGHVQTRAGIAPTPPHVDSPLMDAARADWWIVASASDAHSDALPWALLSLADELDAQR